MSWTSSNARLGGCSDRSGVDPFMLPRPEFEREYDQRDAKNQRVCSQPPGEYNGSDHRRDNKQTAIGKRQEPAETQPPSAIVYVQPKARSRHQPTRDNRPCGNQPHERNNGNARPEKSENSDRDIEQPFKYQQSPAILLAADRPHSRDDSEDSIDQHIGGEQDHQRQHRWAGENQREASEDNADNASQQK